MYAQAESLSAEQQAYRPQEQSDVEAAVERLAGWVFVHADHYKHLGDDIRTVLADRERLENLASDILGCRQPIDRLGARRTKG
jgi:hypothetical protein